MQNEVSAVNIGKRLGLCNQIYYEEIWHEGDTIVSMAVPMKHIGLYKSYTVSVQ